MAHVPMVSLIFQPQKISNNPCKFLDVDTQSNPSWLDKIKQTVHNILQAVNLIKQTPVDKSGKLRVISFGIYLIY